MTDAERIHRQLLAFGEHYDFDAHNGEYTARLRRLIDQANAAVSGREPCERPPHTRRAEEWPLVAYPERTPVGDIPVRLIPVRLVDSQLEGPLRDLFTAFYIDDVPFSHPRFRRTLMKWGSLRDCKWRFQMQLLAAILWSVPPLRRVLPRLSASAADFFNVSSVSRGYQRGHTTGEARLPALLGLQRSVDRTLNPIYRLLQRMLRSGEAGGGFSVALANRTLTFIHRETETLRALHAKGIPVTLLAIGPYDGRHHELAAIRDVADSLGETSRTEFLDRLRVFFFEPDDVGLQIARVLAGLHGINLLAAPALDLTDPDESDLAAFVARERAFWAKHHPAAPNSHIRITMIGSAGEYTWGRLQHTLPMFRRVGIDAVHGSYIVDTPFMRLAARRGKKQFAVRASHTAIVELLSEAGYRADDVFTQPLNPYVTIHALRDDLPGIDVQTEPVFPREHREAA